MTFPGWATPQCGQVKLRLSSTTSPKIQDSFHVWVALQVKSSIPIFVFNNRTQKRTLSANKSPGERILIFGLCLSNNPKWVSRIGTLLEADFGSPATHFEFGYPYRSPIGDSLNGSYLQSGSGRDVMPWWIGQNGEWDGCGRGSYGRGRGSYVRTDVVRTFRH